MTEARGAVSAAEEVFVFPTSFAQQRLWFLDQLVSDHALYLSDVAIRLPTPVDVAALEWALGALVARHESLRTTFVAVDGEPFQRVHEHLDVALVHLQDQAAAARLVREPFDLSVGPLLRAGLLADGLLVICLHHIVTDGWSMRIFFDELHALYSAHRDGRDPQLAPLAIQYPDYALWQRRRLTGPRLNELLAFWQTQLDGLQTLQLPTDRPRPALPSFRGASTPITLPTDVCDALRALAREHGATLFMALLAGLAALLGRYSDQTDIAIGTPVAGRTRSELEPLIGFFVNTLVLRIDLSNDPTYRQLLTRTRHHAINAYAHQDLPFEKLVEHLQPQRDLTRNPLHQILFQLTEAPSANGSAPSTTNGSAATPASDRLAGFSWAASPVQGESAKFDLNLALWDGPGGATGRMAYSSDLFDRSTVQRLVEHFQALLTSVAADPDTPVSRAALLSATERQHHHHRPRPAPPPAHSLLERIDAHAASTPDAPAIGALTYRQLTHAANGLAHHLRDHGAQPDSLIAVNQPPGPQLATALLAIWKAGAAYLPLDPNDPPARRQQILTDAQPLLTLTTNPTTPSRPDPPPHPPQPHHLAYAIYTSGTTGTPKAALIEHHSLTNFVSWFAETVSQPLPWITRLAFDASLKQLFAPLIAGREVWLPSDEAIDDPADLAREVAARDGVALNCVPAHWEAVLDAVAAGRAPSLDDHLTTLVLGGEGLPQSLAERTLRLLPGVRIWNVYGPTETTSVATAARVLAGEPVTIGRPIANVEVVVRDRHRQPVPTGVPGELWIGGAGVARGYLHQPELTALRFVDGWYRSGDRVRQHPDGTLQYLGRLDDQLSLAGHRIEPAEIEQHLQTHPHVHAAAVTIREGHLTAYITGNANTTSLREHLRAQLPAYMQPTRIVTLDALPTTRNGKLDKHALPPPPPPQRQSPTPITNLQRHIAAIWREVLNLPDVGIHDNFFDLGGRSLLLVRVQTRLTAHLNHPIPMLDLFRHPTIHTLATHLTNHKT